MNPEDIGKVLDEIGQRVGPAGEHVYNILVTQQVVYGAVWSAFSIVGILSLAVTSIWFYKFGTKQCKDFLENKNGYSYQSASDWTTPRWLIPLIVNVFFVPLLLIELTYSMMHLLNPEYYAIEQLLTTIAGAIP